MKMKRVALAVSLALFGGIMVSGCNDSDDPVSAVDTRVELSVLGQYQSGQFDLSAAEIVTYDPETRRVFVINAASGEVDILDLSDPANPAWLDSISVSDIGADANSVAVKNGIVAIAVEANTRTDNGSVAFYTTDGTQQSVVEVGALPDALTFSPDGRYVLVANEGEPDGDYEIDPEGSISIIDLQGGVDALTQADVRTADFQAFNGREDDLRSDGLKSPPTPGRPMCRSRKTTPSPWWISRRPR
jgi:DNA-binding beta-propeller fold protein YncE